MRAQKLKSIIRYAYEKVRKMKEIKKIVLIVILQVLLYISGTLVAGNGNGIEKILYERETISLILLVNLVVYSAIGIISILVYGLLNKEVKLISSIIQIVLIYIGITHFELGYHTFMETFKMCKNYKEYVTFSAMVTIIAGTVVGCVIKYFKAKTIN